MDELTASIAHESAHAAAALLTGVRVKGTAVNQRGRGGGSCTLDAHGDADALAVAILCGPMREGHWPPAWPPRKDSPSRDERQLREIADTLSLDEAGWARLTDKAARLTDQSAFASLSGAVALLLRRHGAVSEKQLHRLLNATRVKGEDMHDDEGVEGQRDSDGVLSDDAIDAVLAQERARRVALTNGRARSIDADELPPPFENDDEPLDDSTIKELSLINKAVARADAEHNGRLRRKDFADLAA